jgi:hypothetical protein
MKVTAGDLDRLLHTEIDDPKLIVAGDRCRIVPVGELHDHPDAVGVISRSALRAQLPSDHTPTKGELVHRANILNARITHPCA